MKFNPANQPFRSLIKPIFLLFPFLIFSAFALANNTTYYIDNGSGNNSNNGTSTGTAWYDFTNLNSMTLQPGDQVLFKRGCTWDQELTLTGAGTSTNFIIIDTYGSGSLPKIQRNYQSTDRTFNMIDMSFVKIRNLEICNAGNGIFCFFDTKGHQSIYFEHLNIHNIDVVDNGSPSVPGLFYSQGIDVVGYGLPKPTSVSDYIAKDVRITNCIFTNTTVPLGTGNVISNPTDQQTEFPESFTNILVDSCTIHNFKACVSFRGMNRSVISNNSFINGATDYSSFGTCGIFNFALDSVSFVGNYMDSISETGSADETWVDNEAYCNRVSFIGNNIKNTAGAGIEFLSSGPTISGNLQPPRESNDYSTNTLISNNTFYNKKKTHSSVMWLQALPYQQEPQPTIPLNWETNSCVLNYRQIPVDSAFPETTPIRITRISIWH